jgi:hypothetical protein
MIMEAIFSSRDTYAETRRKFNTAWPLLRIEIHWSDAFYYKEGMNEVSPDTVFAIGDRSDKTFSLDDDTTIEAAEELFKLNFGAREDQLAVYIIDNFVDKSVYPTGKQTLAEASDPFILRPKEFTYHEFQRLFSVHWPGLSIRLFQIGTAEDPGANLTELPAEMELKDLTGMAIQGLWRGRVIERQGVRDIVEVLTENYLHDHLYISDYKNELEKAGIGMAIENLRTNEYWNPVSSPHKLIDFQNAA